MRKLLVLGAVVALAAPAWAAWKWDQLCPADSYAGASWIDNDTPSDAQTADDFLCGSTGPITQADFSGWSYYGEQYIAAFRITFWSDVPATPNDASHPGTLLYDHTFTTWTPFTSDCGAASYSVNMSAYPFYQQAGNVYWFSVQGVMVNDGYFDAWYWTFRERHATTWGDDAAFTSTYFGYAPWSNWGSPAGYGNPALYDGPLPSGYTSLDMCFRLVPEPASVLLLVVSGLVFRRR